MRKRRNARVQTGEARGEKANVAGVAAGIRSCTIPAMLLTFIGAVIGAIFSILTTVTVENFRRPKLDLTIQSPPCDLDYRMENRPAKEMRSVRLELHNRPLPRWMRWMIRSAALQCLGTITFHHLDGQNIFGRSMAARWAGSPEPVPITVMGPGGQQFQILDLVRLTSESRIDVYPDEKTILDVAVRIDSDAECFGWSNESYFSNPLWRNQRWKLPPGRYLVKVEVFSSGQKCDRIFRLVNDVSRTDFRLEAATAEDKRQLRS